MLDQPWATNPTTVYLYTWLLLHADDNGQIASSRAELSELTGLSQQQLRTAIEKLVATKYVTKLATKLPTKFATTLTVYNPTSCEDENSLSNQAINQVINQANNQVSRVYKNLDNNIMSLTKRNNSSLHSELKTPLSRFVKPSIDEIRAYCAEKGYQVDAERFWCFYESKGWMVGKNHMKSWKAACTTWNKSERTTNDTRLKDNSIDKFNTGFSW